MNDEDLREAILHAPPGVYDARSWAYWHVMLDLPKTPLPQRRIISDQEFQDILKKC